MRLLKKIFIITLLVFVALLIILYAIAGLSQNKIADIALRKISENIDAPVVVDEVSFSLIKRFPDATIELTGIRLGSPDSTADIAKVGRAFVSVKTIPLIKEQYVICKVEFENSEINYKVDSLGYSNVDFLLNAFMDESEPSDSLSESTMPEVDLDAFKIRNLTLNYEDDTAKIAAQMVVKKWDASGQLSAHNMWADIEGSVKIRKLYMDGYHLEKLDSASIDFALNYKNQLVEIQTLKMVSAPLSARLDGQIQLDSMFVDLKYSSNNIDLAQMTALLPDEMLAEYGVKSVSGILEMEGIAKGVANDSILPFVESTVSLKNGAVETVDYPAVKKMEFKAWATNGDEKENASTAVRVDQFLVQTLHSSVSGTAQLSNLDCPSYTLQSKVAVKLEEFKSFVPDSIAKDLGGTITGNFYTSGTLPDSITDAFIESAINSSRLNMTCKNVYVVQDSLEVKGLNGTLVYKPGSVKIENLSLKVPTYNFDLTKLNAESDLSGSLLNMELLRMNNITFSMQTPELSASGMGRVYNLMHPDFEIDGDVSADLNALAKFVPDTLVKSMSGEVSGHLYSVGTLNLDSIESAIMPLFFDRTKVDMFAKNVNVTMADTLYSIKGLNGKVRLANDSILVAETRANLMGLDVEVNHLNIANTYHAVMLNQPKKLWVRSDVKLGLIDGELFKPFAGFLIEETDSTKKEANDEIVEPAHYTMDVKGSIAMDSLIYNHAFIDDLAKTGAITDSMVLMLKSYLHDEIRFRNATAQYSVTDTLMIVQNLSVDAFNGNILSSVRVRFQNDSSMMVNVHNRLSKVDVNNMLYSFNDFGNSESLSYKNLTGLLTSNVYSQISFINDSLLEDEMRVKASMRFENGGIYDYKPAMDIGKFTFMNNLDKIEFKTMESELFMLRNKMYIPRTNIISTAMDITFFGMQSMEDDFEYHVQFKLGDVAGKNKKVLERQAKNGEDVDPDDIRNGRLKIQYAGKKPGKGFPKFDSKKAIRSMELKVQTQEKLLDLIFHPQLVSFDAGLEKTTDK